MNSTTPTYNRFEVLSDNEEDNEKPPKTRPPPPIIMRGRPTNTKEFIDKLKEHAGNREGTPLPREVHTRKYQHLHP